MLNNKQRSGPCHDWKVVRRRALPIKRAEAMSDNEHRCGYAAIVGRPNVGKSTLLNTLLGQKVSIVTSKPQTTRVRTHGILTTDDAQIIFVDTPGLHRKTKRLMNQWMNRKAMASLADADVVLFMVEALRITPEDEDVLNFVQNAGVATILLVNKVDRVKQKERLLPFLQELTRKHDYAAVVPLSALKYENVGVLQDLIIQHLPLSPPLYPRDQLTDRDDRFQAAEIIREKLMERLHQELPYGLAVQVESYKGEGDKLNIGAVIWVERKGQKSIVIGKKGDVLKDVGRNARLELNALTGRKVHLELWVKVKENWSDSTRALNQFGFDR